MQYFKLPLLIKHGLTYLWKPFTEAVVSSVWNIRWNAKERHFQSIGIGTCETGMSMMNLH